VQSKILKAHPTAHLRVYAIWVDKLFGDARNRWDAAGLTDPRVVHLWDAQDVSGDWLVDHVRGYQGTTGTPTCCLVPICQLTSQRGPRTSFLDPRWAN
jgi:hypothetical protein